MGKQPGRIMVLKWHQITCCHLAGPQKLGRRSKCQQEASPRHLLDSPAGTKYGDHSPSWWTWMVLKVQGSRKPLSPGHTRTAGHPVWHRACRMSPGAVVHPPSVAYEPVPSSSTWHPTQGACRYDVLQFVICPIAYHHPSRAGDHRQPPGRPQPCRA